MFFQVISKNPIFAVKTPFLFHQNSIIKANFSRFVSKEGKRVYKQYQGKFHLLPYLKDDLYYCDQYQNEENEWQKSGIDKVANDYLRFPDTQVDKKGICLMMYNLADKGKKDVDYSAVFTQLEQHLYKYKEQYSSRLVFGALYGCYKTNAASKYCISYFEEEFYRVKKDVEGMEFLNLINAISYNKAKTEKQKHDFIDKHLKKGFLEKYDKVKHNSTAMQNLFYSFQRINYFDKDLCEKVIPQIVNNTRIRNIAKLTSLYEAMQNIDKSGKFYRSLSEEIKKIGDKLTSRADSDWLYDVENMRPRSYEEVQKRAESYVEEDSKKQQLGKWLYVKQENLELYKQNKENILKVAEEIENQAKTQELNDLIFEKFILENMEETQKQEEDEDLFKGKVEKNQQAYHNLKKTAVEDSSSEYNEEIEKMVEEEFNEQKKEAEQLQNQGGKKKSKQEKK